MRCHTVLLCGVVGLASSARADVDLRMNLYADTGPELVGPESTLVVGVGQTVRFVLLAEMAGGPSPAFTSFTADLAPFWPCGGTNARVESFTFGDWPLAFEQPRFEFAAIVDGAASQPPLPGLVDDSNPLVVCTFDVRFTGGPERLVYEAIPTGDEGVAFGAVADSTTPFSPIFGFGPSAFRSVRVIAVGSPGDPPPCSPADLVPPYGTHDLADLQAFIAGFVAQQCRADVAPPWAVFDLADVQSFVQHFVDGCH